MNKVAEIKKLLRQVLPASVLIISYPSMTLQGFRFIFIETGRKDFSVGVNSRYIDDVESKYIAFDLMSRWLWSKWNVSTNV